MKICSYTIKSDSISQKRIGIISNENTIIDPNFCLALKYEKENRYNPFERANHNLPFLLSQILKKCDSPIKLLSDALSLYEKFKKQGDLELSNGTSISLTLDESIKLNPPLDKISTYRDFYAHEKHVAAGFKKRNEPIPEAWYEIPAYYKGATEGFIGHQDEILWPSYTNVLDYELELAVVIGKEGKNIKAKNACEHIFGFTILNDISARDIQKKEMAVRLGPAKGKDFCSIIGPVITTIDEFNYTEPDLLMTAKVNGVEWSRGQSGDTNYSFSKMIEHVSQDEWIIPGDLFGSGTVGTGCGLELDKWIQEDDIIEMEIQNIGKLINKVGKKQIRK